MVRRLITLARYESPGDFRLVHARIRYWRGRPALLDEIYRSGRHMVARLDQVPGFVSFIMLDLGGGCVAGVYVCNELAALEEADRLAECWYVEHLDPSAEDLAQTASGEVVLQRGL